MKEFKIKGKERREMRKVLRSLIKTKYSLTAEKPSNLDNEIQDLQTKLEEVRDNEYSDAT